MQTVVDGRELTAQDRCDACSAAAKVIATLINGELMFCGHHAKKLKISIKNKSVAVWDPEGVLDLL
jgi:hypothetical protein